MEPFPDGNLFGPGACATWVQSTGTLTMTTQSELSPSDFYQVIFSLRNPFEEQASPDVKIRGSIVADGPVNAVLKPLSMTKDTATVTSGVEGGAAVLFIVKPTFTVRRIAQDNPFALATNILTATLQFNTDVPENSEISITGLTGASTATSAAFPVTISPTSNQAFESTASWNSAGSLTVSATSLGATSGTLYTVTFTLTNDAFGQASPDVTASGFVNTAPGFENGALTESQFDSVLMSKPAVDLFGVSNASHPLFIVVPFAVKNISQSSPIISNSNTITVTLRTNADLYAADGTVVTIFGLVDTATASTNALALTYPDANQVFGASADWVQSTGTLTLTQAAATLSVGEVYSFSIDVVNPSVAQPSPSVSISATGTTTILPSEMTRAPDLFAPLAVMGLSTKRIVQETPTPDFSNTISITLAFTTNLPSTNTIVTITNLTGAAGPDTLSLSGDTAFLGVRSWDRPNGVLELDVLQALTLGVDYSVSFLISNPQQGQPGPNVTIAVTVDGLLVVDSLQMDLGDGAIVGTQPLLINEFTTANIGQTDPGQGVVNTIVVTVATRAELFASDRTFLIICNLLGTTTSSGSLSISDVGSSGAVDLFGSSADWTLGTVTINFQSFGENCLDVSFGGTAANSVAGKQYTFSFALTNPFQSQEGPSPITITAFFRQRFSQTFLFDNQMTRGEGINEPLLVNGFLATFISQSTASTSLTNIISLRFRARAPFPPGAVITISNILGAVNPAGSLVLNGGSVDREYFADAAGERGRGSWQNGTQGLLLHVANETARNTTYALSFNVTNPDQGQLPPAVSIASNGTAALVYGIEMAAPPYIFDKALAVFGWTTQMGQSNPVARGANTLGITLTSVITTGDNPLPTIRITVLEGAVAEEGNLTLEDRSSTCGGPGDCLGFFSAFANSGTGLGQWSNSSKVLTLFATEELLPGSYAFSFNVTNARFGQFSPAIVVETIGYNYRSAQPVGKDAGNAAPLAIGDFDTRAIGQDNAQLGAVNRISVTLVSTLELSAASSFLTISGLSGSVTESTATLALSNLTSETGRVFASSGVWERNGTLTIEVLDTIRANVLYEFSFVLTNPGQGQQSPVVFIALSGEVPFFQRPMQRGASVFAPLFVVEFAVAAIAQSTPLARLNNVITVTLQTNFDVESLSSDYIAIFPFTNAIAGASLTLDPVGGSGAATIFSDGASQGTAKFENEVLKLFVFPGQTLLKDTLYTFSFNVTNPALTQLAPSVSVEKIGVFNVTRRPFVTPDRPVLGVANGTNPLRVVLPEFTIRGIAQDAPFASVANTITVSLQPNVNLAYADGSAVTISATPPTSWDTVITSSSLQLLPAAGGNAGELKFSNGSTSAQAAYSSGTIALTVAFNQTVRAEVTYVFKFAVTNPFLDQTAPPDVRIEASGTARFEPRQMQVPNAVLKGVANGTDFGTVVIPRWLEARGAQSTFAASTINTITLTLQSNVDLSSSESSRVSVLNLRNAIAADPLPLGEVAGGNDAYLLFSDLSGSPRGRAVLRGDTLLLTVAANQSLSSFVSYIFSFNITNPSADQEAPEVSVEANGTATIPATRLDTPGITQFAVTNASDPLRVLDPLFTLSGIAQSDPLALRVNTISVTLQTNVDLRHAEGSVITMSGFDNAIQNASVPITDVADGNNASLLFSDGTRQGFAAYSSGTFTFFLFANRTMFAGETFKFRFEVINPNLRQAIPPPRISATGTVRFRERAMDTPNADLFGVPNGTNPLNLEVTPVFLTAFARQQTPIASFVNRITVTLRLNIILASTDNSVVTISNFVGATASSSVQIYDEPSGNAASTFFSDGTTQQRGSFANETLTLFVHTGQTLGAQTDYIFSFDVTNPAQDQEPPTLFVEATGTVIFPRTTLTTPNEPLKGIPNATNPLLVVVPRFTISNIAQSTVVASRTNRLTVTLQTNINLAYEDSSIITISSLSNAVVPTSAKLESVSGGNDGDQLFTNGSATGFALFDSVSDSLALQLGVNRTLVIDVVYILAFIVTNPAGGQDSPVVQISASGGVPIQTANMTKGEGNDAPLLVADFTIKTVVQSTPSQKAQNVITISLATRADLFSIDTGIPSRVTITGLTGSNTSSGALTISGAVANFGTSASWDKDSGTLELNVVANTTARQVYVLSFTLLNPDFGQDSPQVNVSSSGIEIRASEVDKASGNAAPLLVADFTTLAIGQSTPSASTSNTITLTLATRADLTASNTIVTVTGLTGSHQYSSSVDVTSVSSPARYSPLANWEFVSGTVAFSLTADTSAGQEYVISFELKNPALAQSSPEITISATGIRITDQLMTKALNNSAPLLVAGFIAPVLQQATPSPQASNQLQLDFSCNVVLATSTTITLSGLTGSATSSDASLSIAGSVASFGVSASWNSSGVLVFTAAADSAPQELFTLTFVLQNGDNGQFSPDIVISSGSIVMTPIQVAKGAGNTAPLLIAGYVMKGIGQSSAKKAVVNTITVTIAPYAIHSTSDSCAFTITGLTGSDTPSGALRLEEISNSSVFGSSAPFDQTTGTLQLVLAGDMSSGRLYVVRFNLTNPNAFLSSPSVSVTASGVVIPQIAMDRGSNANAPLLVITPEVAPTSCSNLQSWVQLNASSSFSPRRGFGLVVRGAFPLSDVGGSGATAVFTNEGAWLQSSGSIILGVSRDQMMLAGVPYVLSVELGNPQAGQTAPTVEVEARGSATIAPESMVPDDTVLSNVAGSVSGDKSPLKVYGDVFTQATIGQSTPYPGAVNTLTATIASARDLTAAGSCAVIIAGLQNTQTANNAALAIQDNGSPSASTLFGGSGSWLQATGALALPIAAGQTMLAGVAYSFSWQVVNPSSAQAAASVLMFSSGTPLLSPTTMVGDATTVPGVPGAMAGDAEPLKVYGAGFAVKAIGQSTPYPGATNTVTLTIASNIQLVGGGSISVSGLTGSLFLQNSNATTSENVAGVFSNVSFSAGSGVLLLQVGSSSTLDANLTFNAFVTVRNPLSAQSSPQVDIVAADGTTTIASTAMDRDTLSVPAGVPGAVAGDASPLKVDAPSFVVRNIGQTSPYPATNNTITATLTTSYDLSSSEYASVYIAGLTGSATQDGPLEVSGSLNVTASWAQNQGIVNITLPAGTTLQAGISSVLSFVLSNPTAAQAAPSVSVAAVSRGASTFFTSPEVMIPDATTVLPLLGATAGDASPLKILGPVFSTASIGQSSPFPLANNTLTVTIASALDLTAAGSCVVTIAGLLNTNTADTPQLPIQDVGTPGNSSGASTLFGGSGSWLQATGALALPIAAGQTMLAGVAYSFSWQVVNPSSAQAAASVAVFSSGTPAMGTTTMVGDATTVPGVPGAMAGDAEPLKVYGAGFAVKAIGQSTPYPGATNTVTLTLATTVDVLGSAQTFVTVAGLVGSATPDSTLAIAGGSGNLPQPFDSAAVWAQAEGALVLALPADRRLVAGTAYAVSFQLLNPAAHQQAPTNVRVGLSSPAQTLASELMDLDTAAAPAGVQGAVAGDGAPLRVYPLSFITARTGQSTALQGVQNTVTVTLTSTYNLSYDAGSQITIRGLVGATTADSEEMVLAGGFNQSGFHDDVHASTDGETWRVVASAAGWTAREGHALVLGAVGSNQTLFLIAGRTARAAGGDYLRDVWRSADGAAWELVTAVAAFPPRAYFGAAASGQRLLVMGGAADAPTFRLNDVWSSEDGGQTWTATLAAAPWSGRYGFAFLFHASPDRSTAPSLVEDSGKTRSLVVFAGAECEAACARYDNSIAGCETLAGGVAWRCCVQNETCALRRNVNDVFSSADYGATWQQRSTAGGFRPSTFSFVASNVDGAMVLAGGYESWDRFEAELWVGTDDGEVWTNATPATGTGFLSRSAGQMVLHRQCLKLVGGHTRYGAGTFQHYNDVWQPAS